MIVSSGDNMKTTIRMSGLFLRVTTPLRWTSSGSCGVAIATRFWTSTCALSRSVPSLNVTVIVSWPFEVAWLGWRFECRGPLANQDEWRLTSEVPDHVPGGASPDFRVRFWPDVRLRRGVSVLETPHHEIVDANAGVVRQAVRQR